MCWLRSVSKSAPQPCSSKNTVEREADQELRFHLEREVAQQNFQRHVSEEARRVALLEFAGWNIQGRLPRARGVNRIETLLRPA